MYRSAIRTAIFPCVSGTEGTLCMYVCVCRKVSSKTGSTISMQDRLATDQVQPSPRPLAPHSCFSCRPHEFGVSCSITSAEGHKHSHFSLHSFVTVGTTALCRSLIMLSFVLALNFFFFFFLSLFATLSLSLSLNHFISPSHSHLIPHALFLPTSIIPPFVPPFVHLLSCLISSSPGDRVQVTDDSNEEWWKVGNKSFANVCVCAGVCLCVLVLCA